MHKVRIQTAQNVDIEYAAASVGDRIVAYLIDLLFIAAYGLVAFAVFWLASFLDLLPHALHVALAILFFLPLLLYDLVLELMLDGQSFGKRRRAIKVVEVDGSQPGIGSYLLRWLLRPIDILLFSGGVALLTILINGKGQRLGDLAAGTAVVKLKPHTTLDDTILSAVETGYTPVFPQAAHLDEKVVATVKEVLNQAAVLAGKDGERTAQMLHRTKTVLENSMALKSDLPPRDFLETLMKDYSALVADGRA